MIASVGLPCAYDHFKAGDGPGKPPFVCFLYPNRDDFMADNTSYVKITALHIELYTDNVRFDLEDALEAALIAAELTFSKDGPRFIDSERMYMTTYDTEVLLTDVDD